MIAASSSELAFHAALDYVELYRRTLVAIRQNADAYHAGNEGKANALAVIKQWADAGLSGRLHPSVEKITEADGG